MDPCALDPQGEPYTDIFPHTGGQPGELEALLAAGSWPCLGTALALLWTRHEQQQQGAPDRESPAHSSPLHQEAIVEDFKRTPGS